MITGGEAARFRLQLLQETVTWAEKLEEYGVRATVRLDDKAQQTGGLAGIFLAAAFGFMKPDSFALLGPRLRTFATVMLLVIVSVLVMCIGACLSVSWLRTVPIPIALSVAMKLNDTLLNLKTGQMTSEVQENYYHDRLRLWQDTLDARSAINKLKAWRLRAAQVFLAAGIVLSASLLVVVVSSFTHLPHHVSNAQDHLGDRNAK